MGCAVKVRLRYHWQFDAWIQVAPVGAPICCFVGRDPIGKQMFFGVE